MICKFKNYSTNPLIIFIYKSIFVTYEIITNMKFIVGITAIISSFIFLYLTQKYFLKRNIIDNVNERSSHNKAATRSGGIGIFLSILLISIYYYFNGIQIFDYSIIIPLSLLLIVGLYDDLYDVDFKLKFLFQIITAKILIDNGFIIDNFHGILGLYELNRIFAQILSVFIIVAIINSINFIDGIDGLAVLIVSLFKKESFFRRLWIFIIRGYS